MNPPSLLPPWIVDDAAPEPAADPRGLADAFAAIGLAQPGARPSPELRERVIEGAQHPLRAFLDRAARLIDVPLERAADLLDRLADADFWPAEVAPGVCFVDLPTVPAAAGAVVGFVRVRAGRSFPAHAHLGDEVALVLQGALRTDDGREYHPGDHVLALAGSTHLPTALPGEDLVWLSVSREGIDFAPVGGRVMRPPSRG